MATHERCCFRVPVLYLQTVPDRLETHGGYVRMVDNEAVEFV